MPKSVAVTKLLDAAAIGFGVATSLSKVCVVFFDGLSLECRKRNKQWASRIFLPMKQPAIEPTNVQISISSSTSSMFTVYWTSCFAWWKITVWLKCALLFFASWTPIYADLRCYCLVCFSTGLFCFCARQCQQHTPPSTELPYLSPPTLYIFYYYLLIITNIDWIYAYFKLRFIRYHCHREDHVDHVDHSWP